MKDQREQQTLRDRITKLKNDPEKQEKPLSDSLPGYRSVWAVGQRYRIIYRVEQETIVVLVVGVGRRKEGDKKDIYSMMERLLEE
ncbi:type II toxin-antitoxin system RelE family toxin [Phormidesmis priestleyi]